MDEESEMTAAEELKLLAEYSTDVIARVDQDMILRYLSPSAERLFRRPNSTTVGRPMREFVLEEDLPVVSAATAKLIAGETKESTVTVRAIRGDGSLLWVEVSSRPIGAYKPGEPSDRAVVMRDVNERKLLEERLIAMAMIDGLTGLANRRAFDEALEREWRRTVREKSQMSLVLIDIDFFKPFNDAYGHQAGDDCLKAIGTTLLALALRPGDLVARYGGEELAIILARSDTEGAAIVAERARSAIESLRIPHRATTLDVGIVTASIGVATAMALQRGSADLPSALLSAADRALYDAKNAGRNLVMTALLPAQPA